MNKSFQHGFVTGVLALAVTLIIVELIYLLSK